MDKRFWGILVAIVLVFGVIFWFTSNKKTTGNNSSQPTNHIEGQNSAGVTLVEYGDYECPFCGQYYPVVKQVAALYAPYIHFQFRNLPLTSLHPNAFAAARAAEAAALQNKFWEMHDLLYENQNQWVNTTNPDNLFNSYAQSLSLNITKFKQDFASDQVNNSINADVSAFNSTGQQEATPSFFLDSKFVSPAENLTSFEKLLNAEIKQKTGSEPTISTSSNASSGTNTTPRSTQ